MAAAKPSKHAKQLEALKNKDPEFLAFLQQNDPSLLAFGGDDDSDSEGDSSSGAEHGAAGAGQDGDEDRAFEEDSSSDEDEPERVLGATIPKPGEAGGDSDGEGGVEESSAELLTEARLGEVVEAAFAQRRLKGLQVALHAFRAAVHAQDDKPPSTLRFRIESDLVFSKVLAAVLTNARATFAHHLQGAVASVGPFTVAQLTRCKRFRKVAPLLQSFLSNIAHLVGQTLDASLLLLVLRSLKLYLPFFGAFPKLAQRITKALLRLYGSEFLPTVPLSAEDSEGAPLAPVAPTPGRGRKRSRGDAASADLQSALATGPTTDGGVTVRAVAFLRLRQAAVELPYPALDTILKGVYSAYMALVKKLASSEGRVPMARMMAAGVVEIASLDMPAAYQHGFVFLRQLALHLRAALTAKSPAAVSAVLSWPFLGALRVWTAVLVAHGSDDGSPLWQLVYPLVQLSLGVLRLTRTIHKYFYLRLHVLSCLGELSARCGVFLPLGTHIMDLLEVPHFLSGMGKPPKGAGTSKPPLFATTFRLSDKVVGHKAVLDHTVTTSFALLAKWLRAHSDTVAYPEVTTPLVVRLKKWIKAARTGAWKSAGRAALKKINTRSKVVMGARASASGLCPAELADVAAFQARTLTKPALTQMREGGPAAADAVLTALWLVAQGGSGSGTAEEGLDALGVGALATAGAAAADAALEESLAGGGAGSKKRRVAFSAPTEEEEGEEEEEAGGRAAAAVRVHVPDMEDTVTAFALEDSDDE